MSDIQYRSFAEVFAAKLAEQNIQIDPASLPDDPSQCDTFLEGDGTHLAGTVFEPYVEAWGWETLQPLLQTAMANTAGVEWSPDGGTGAGGEYGASDRDAQATWRSRLRRMFAGGRNESSPPRWCCACRRPRDGPCGPCVMVRLR